MAARPDDVLTARLEGGPADSAAYEIDDLADIVLTKLISAARPQRDDFRWVYRYSHLEPVDNPGYTHEGTHRAVFVFDPNRSTP